MRFAQQNGILCGTRLETVGQLLRWCKILRHRESSPDLSNIYDDGYQWAHDFFGYQGAPPVQTMLSGAKYNGTIAADKTAYPGVMHWTTGCHCTSLLIQNVLAALNIPVFRIDVDNPAWLSLQGANEPSQAGMLRVCSALSAGRSLMAITLTTSFASSRTPRVVAICSRSPCRLI